MKVWARVNHVGWVHLWRHREDYERAEPSVHFLNGRTDPRWVAVALTDEQKQSLATGDLVEIEDPGYFAEDD